MARGRREKIDVRWDVETAETARRVAGEVGRSAAEVLRRAAAAGMASAAAALRAEVAGGEGRPRGAKFSDPGSSGPVGRLPGAGGASPGPGPQASSPRPAPAAPASLQTELGGTARRKLEVEVARRAVGGQPQPVDVARARRAILAGRVAVAGVVCREPGRLVDPATVAPVAP
jgi:hypothetical protein